VSGGRLYSEPEENKDRVRRKKAVLTPKPIISRAFEDYAFFVA
jgi:hypothetical protein